MAGEKTCSTGVLDSIFSYLYASTMRICVTTSSSPRLLNSGSSNTALAISTGGSYPTTAYFTIGSSGNNRYCTISACSCDDVNVSGAAACVILFNVTCSEVSYVTTCTTVALSTGNKVNVGTWTITVNQPT